MVWALDVTHSWALVGVRVREMGEWAGGAYLGPPFLCLWWLSVWGIPYALSWTFGPTYAICSALVVLVVLVWLVDAGDVVVATG